MSARTMVPARLGERYLCGKAWHSHRIRSLPEVESEISGGAPGLLNGGRKSFRGEELGYCGRFARNHGTVRCCAGHSIILGHHQISQMSVDLVVHSFPVRLDPYLTNLSGPCPRKSKTKSLPVFRGGGHPRSDVRQLPVNNLSPIRGAGITRIRYHSDYICREFPNFLVCRNSTSRGEPPPR